LNIKSSWEKEEEFNSRIFSQKEVNHLRGEMRKIIYQSTIEYEEFMKDYKSEDSANPEEMEEVEEINEEEKEIMEHNSQN